MIRLLPALFLSFFLLCAPARAESVYWQRDALLADMFPGADALRPAPLQLTAEQAAALKAQLGAPLPSTTFDVVEAWQGATFLGWVIFDQQIGQHEPISFAVQLSPAGQVVRHEVVVYRERYGDAVKDKRFRAQFVGKTAADPITAGKDIRIVSGATYSSRAMAIGVKRDVALGQLLVARRAQAD